MGDWVKTKSPRFLGKEKKWLYFEKLIISGKVIEVVKSYSMVEIKNHDKGPRVKRSSEDMIKENFRQAVKKLTRLMNCNFKDGDLHVVLTYKKDRRPNPDRAKKEFTNFIRRVSYRYKKRGLKCKWITVTEYKSKAIHHHVVLNNIDGMNVIKLIQKQWKQNGLVHVTPLYSDGQYKDLAEYFVKETKETYKEKDGGRMQRWTCSRNLKKPKVKIKVRRANRWSPNPKPKKGYVIETDSIVSGVNGFTGKEYQRYTMVRIE